MKKIFVILCVAIFALTLCSCGDVEPRTPNESETEPASVATEAETEPEIPEEPPIEISEFCDPEDMPEPFSGDAPAVYTSESDGITVDGRSFTLEWLYLHNIYDWRAAGIPFDGIDDKTSDYLDCGFTDAARDAFKQKISDFTMLSFLGTTNGTYVVSAPSITLGDETFGLDWLSSHNATEYTEAGLDADIVSQYLDALAADYWYTPEYRWIQEVHNRLVNGW